MSFEKEVEKVADAADAVTSRWKTWLIMAGFVVGAVVVVVAAVKFWF